MKFPNFTDMDADQLNEWYEKQVGYRPQEDDPSMTVGALRQLCQSYAEAVKEET